MGEPLIGSAEEFCRLRSRADPTEYGRASEEAAPEAVWLEVIRTMPEMRFWVVVNKTVPTSILAILSTDENPSVRAAVARTRRTPPEVLKRLAADLYDAARMAVAMNAKAPLEVLGELTRDIWKDIADVAAQRLSAQRFDSDGSAAQ